VHFRPDRRTGKRRKKIRDKRAAAGRANEKIRIFTAANLNMQKTLVIAGGGAAGFFCAVNAARLDPQLRVLIVEKTGKLLSKVKVSGGGRCNVTHACFSIEDMIRHYPRGARFLKKSFHEFFTPDAIRWFEARGVKLKAEDDGRMFPVSNSSQTIIDCLLAEAEKYRVEIRLRQEIRSVEAGAPGAAFRIHFSSGPSMDADFLCIACGGYSKSALFDWIRQTGHSIEEPVPSLFTFNMPGNPVTTLQGISVPLVRVSIADSPLEETGPLLITHWGMSGPVVLKLSAWGARLLGEKHYRFDIRVNWLPAYSPQALREACLLMRRESGSKKIRNKNPWQFPQRLWEWQLRQAGIGDISWSDLTAALQHQLIQQLGGQLFPVSGKTTFKEEFVMAGGVRLAEIRAHTMESRIRPRLFFAGEVMDVDGVTGGFNFQHAWTSGFIAARTIAGYASGHGGSPPA
jgi:predicted Rossmann fold flavoprotein